MSTGTGPRRLGKYELHQLLGRTGMAEVWKAFDTHLQRLVALKLLQADPHNDPNFVARFEREARVVASLHHRNIVQIHDFQVARPPESPSLLAYMVMDYIEGPTLADYIAHTSARQHFPPAGDLVRLFAAISSAVDYAHQHGVIHRDIKPANILLDQHTRSRNPMGEPLLTDFGIAKLLGTSTGLASGSWSGTELYLSPEQAQGYVGNEHSDLYSLGVILYELCTGTRPFQGKSPTLILQQHITATPTSPVLLNPAIPPALTMLILRGLAKDPAARFPNASAMTQALAQALNVDLPEDLSPPLSPPDAMHEPTLFRPRPSRAELGLTPASPFSPAALATPPFPATVNAGQSAPVARVSTSSPGSNAASIVTNPVSSPGATTLVPPPSSMPMQKRRRTNRLVVLIAALLLLLLLGSGLGTFYLLSHQAAAPLVTTNPIVGHAFFISSGEFIENSSQGFNDQLQINLSNIPNPAPGKSYYAWLLGDKNQSNAQAILLGKLSVDHGNVHFPYRGNQNHTNLFKFASRILITEENANITPANPSLDKRTWRYNAEISQTPDPKDTAHHLSMLDHLRDLLAEDTPAAGTVIYGGLDTQLFRQTEKILEWAGSARDEKKSIPLMRNQFIRILDYLDGEANVQADVPAGTPMLVRAPFAILGPDTSSTQNIVYLDEITAHLNTIARLPGGTPDKLKLIAQIRTALGNIKKWLEQVRQDAKQLINMTGAQLLQSATLSILDNMYSQAFYAYVGRLNPSTDEEQSGVIQMYYYTQHLAIFDIQSYKSS